MATFAGLTPDTTYEVKVLARNKVRLSSGLEVLLADSVVLEVKTKSALSDPEKVKVEATSTTTSLEVQWSEPLNWGRNANGTWATSGNIPYEVWYKAKSSSSGFTQASLTNGRTVTVTSLDENTIYLFVVKANSSNGQFSSDTTEQKLDLSQPPTKPVFRLTALDFTGQATASIALKVTTDYTDIANAGKIANGSKATVTLFYKYKNHSDASYTGGTTTYTGTGNDTLITGLIPNTLYDVKVNVINSAGLKDSAELSLSTLAVAFTGFNYGAGTPRQVTRQGRAISSPAPTTTPADAIVGYSIPSPPSSNFTIASNTGVVTADNTTPAGRYLLTVQGVANGSYSGTQTATYSIIVLDSNLMKPQFFSVDTTMATNQDSAVITWTVDNWGLSLSDYPDYALESSIKIEVAPNAMSGGNDVAGAYVDAAVQPNVSLTTTNGFIVKYSSSGNYWIRITFTNNDGSSSFRELKAF